MIDGWLDVILVLLLVVVILFDSGSNKIGFVKVPRFQRARNESRELELFPAQESRTQENHGWLMNRKKKDKTPLADISSRWFHSLKPRSLRTTMTSISISMVYLSRSYNDKKKRSVCSCLFFWHWTYYLIASLAVTTAIANPMDPTANPIAATPNLTVVMELWYVAIDDLRNGIQWIFDWIFI